MPLKFRDDFDILVEMMRIKPRPTLEIGEHGTKIIPAEYDSVKDEARVLRYMRLEREIEWRDRNQGWFKQWFWPRFLGRKSK